MKFKLRNFFVILCMMVCGALLLHTSQRVQKAEIVEKELRRKISLEDENVKILRSEWAFLNNPDRLEMLTHKYLNVHPVAPEQLTLSARDYFLDPEVTSIQQANGEDTKSSIEEGKVSVLPVVDRKSQAQNFNALLQRVATGER